jgi:hypothetical protein
MIKIGVIGCGNAGNQVAELANNLYSIPACAINSSEKDLSTVTIKKIHIGTQGSGKDRDIAKSYMKKEIKNLLNGEVLRELIDDKEVIFIVSSTGGGSGSGISPMLYEVLSSIYATKRFILIGILPEIKESIASQQNTIEYLTELQSIEDITYMLYDNNRRMKLPMSEILPSINMDVVEDINILSGYYLHTTPLNSIDEKDMFKIIGTVGMLNISKLYNFKEKDLDNQDIEDLFIDYMKNKTGTCEMERDGIIKRSGLILLLKERLQSYIDSSMSKVKKLYGEPLESFHHDVIIDDNNKDEINRAIYIMSGLSIPDDRIAKIMERIEEVKEAMLKTKSTSLLDDADCDDIKLLRMEKSKEIDESKDVNPLDIMAKFMK